MYKQLSILLLLVSIITTIGCKDSAKNAYEGMAEDVLKDIIISNAEWAMLQEPQTVTSFQCSRSAGNTHDFYSEGDYWWPDPSNTDAPYIRKDGETNPYNFVEHRLAMIRFSKIVGYLASAYKITGDDKYVSHALAHVHAWFINPETKMNPNLLYAQAIKGITQGRGIGIIDTIHLMEVAQGIICMQNSPNAEKQTIEDAKKWFSDYLAWLTTHQNGIDEMNAKNNHGTCWVMQAASFAKLTENNNMLDFCRQRYKNVLLPDQMDESGGFPKELSRTKPYGYSLFNLDAMTTICQILSTSEDDLWQYTSLRGLNIRKGVEFMYPYIQDKQKWTYQEDVMYWNDWPVAQPALLFAASAYNDQKYFDVWKGLKHTTEVAEVERNLPIRNPLIWME